MKKKTDKYVYKPFFMLRLVFWIGAIVCFISGIILKISNYTANGGYVSKYGDYHSSSISSTGAFIICGVFLFVLYFLYHKPRKKPKNT